MLNKTIKKFYEIQRKLLITDRCKHDNHLRLLGYPVIKYTTPSGLQMAERCRSYHYLTFNASNFGMLKKIVRDNYVK